MFGGDFVGGNFVFVMLFVLCDVGDLFFVVVVLFFFWVDFLNLGDIFVGNVVFDYVGKEYCDFVVCFYFDGCDVCSVEVLLFYVDLIGLLLLFVYVGGFEMLCD